MKKIVACKDVMKTKLMISKWGNEIKKKVIFNENRAIVKKTNMIFKI
jgi:hypothetical protein